MGVLLTSEVRRIFRSPRFVIFTIAFPVVYFLIFSGIYAKGSDGPETIIALMVMMAAFGAISASVNTGGRVAIERGIGWNRQLRLTPLPAWTYLAVKALVSMIVALPALLLVFVVAAVVKGVDLSPLTWVQVFLAAWIGVLPFASIGLLVGLFGTPDSAQGMSMVTMLLFSLLGGVFIPPSLLPAAMASIAKALPSYWLVDIAMGRAFGTPIASEGVAVMIAWVLVIGGLVVVRYRRDTLRV